MKPIFQLLLKAIKDPNFKTALAQDPKKVLEEECGMTLPENCKVQVLQDTADTTNIVIPYIPQLDKIKDNTFVSKILGSFESSESTGAKKNFTTFMKVLTDPQYKAQLMQNPREFLQKECGLAIPGNSQIKVVESTPDTVYIAIPWVPNAQNLDLKALKDMFVGGGAGGNALGALVIKLVAVGLTAIGTSEGMFAGLFKSHK